MTTLGISFEQSGTRTFLLLMTLMAACSWAHGQGAAASLHKRADEKTAYVSFVNACTTDLQERWKASADIAFKGVKLATDLRVGENSLLRPVEIDGRGVIEVRRHGTDEVLFRVPANLQPGAFSTVVLLGMIGTKTDVNAVVLRDYPLDENQKRPGFARLVLLSTISNYPTKVGIGGEGTGKLPVAVTKEHFLTSGEKEVRMFFRDNKFGDRELHTSSGLVAKEGGNYNVIFFDSPKMPGRPNVLIVDVDMQRKELLDTLTVDDESTANPSKREALQ